MPGIKGMITRSKGGKEKAVYLSDLFGIWQEGQSLHFTSIKGQNLHTSISPQDGLLFDALMMLYQYGLRIEN